MFRLIFNQRIQKLLSFKVFLLREMSASSSKGKNRKHVAVSYENDDKKEDEVVPKKKSKTEPENWKIIYENIKKMRDMYSSPVDNMGCEKCFDQNTSPQNQRYQTLVALMLSAQTRDEVTYAACQRLKYISIQCV